MTPPRTRRPADRTVGDRAVIERAQRDRGPAARRAAVERFLPLARSLAHRYHRGDESYEDLEQVACIGLLKAIDGFDLSRGTAFGSFAVPTIAGELRRHFRDRGWTVRVPRDLQELSLKLGPAQDALAAELGRPVTAAELAERLHVAVERVLEARELPNAMRPVSLDRPMSVDDDREGGPLVEQLGCLDEGYDRADDGLTAQELLSRLPELERAVVVLRFRDELTQSQIGDRLGVSQMKVSRVLRRALEELTTAAEAL
jgi:RNA polymerase sigma-B factor